MIRWGSGISPKELFQISAKGTGFYLPQNFTVIPDSKEELAPRKGV